MAVLIQIANASKRYGEQVLLDGASAIISENVKVGFVGRNGAGKSTLLRITANIGRAVGPVANDH
ncbi:MAG: ATP-binding cassette domain-containing protein, partial [Planctomycetota bacterium]